MVIRPYLELKDAAYNNKFNFCHMEINKNLEKLDINDVIALDKEIFDRGFTLKATQLLEEYYQNISHKIGDWKASILTEGIECEVLRVNEGKWRKGKIKLILEFEPDEPEFQAANHKSDSLLDDIRQAID
jgi:KGK domain